MDNFLTARKPDEEPRPVALAETVEIVEGNNSPAWAKESLGLGPFISGGRINVSPEAGSPLEAREAAGPSELDMYDYIDMDDMDFLADGVAGRTDRKAKKDVAVEYNGHSVRFPCSTTLRVCVEKNGGNSCIAEVHDASGWLIEKFSPNLENQIREDAEASVIAQANSLIKRLNEAQVEGGVVMDAAGGRGSANKIMASALDQSPEDLALGAALVLGVVAIIVVVWGGAAGFLGWSLPF